MEVGKGKCTHPMYRVGVQGGISSYGTGKRLPKDSAQCSRLLAPVDACTRHNPLQTSWDRSVALPPHVRDVSEFELSSVATLNRALVRMSAEESVEESVDVWAVGSSLGSRMSAGESAETLADECAVVSSIGSRMFAGESAEASADEWAGGSSVGSQMSVGESSEASADE